MNTPGQAFFAAYRPLETSAVRAFVEVAPRHQRKGAASGRQQSSNSVDNMYANGACYRIDQGHVERFPPPYRVPPTVSRQPKTLETRAVDTGCFDLGSEVQSISVILAPSFPLESVLPPQPEMVQLNPSVPTAAAIGDEQKTDVEKRTAPAASALDENVTARHETAKPRPVWTATWEVDEFAWPDEALNLFESHKDYFLYAGEKLRDASREGLKVLAVAATREKEGCTTLAVCLARGAAAAGAKVALIDCNLRNPDLGFKLGLDFSRGWQESYSNTSSLPEAAVLSLHDKITLFPLSIDHRVPSLCDSAVSRVFRCLSEVFDLVVIDSGAIPSGVDPFFETANACPVQAAMVVRDLRQSTETETLATATRLKALGIEAIGIAENFAGRQSNRAAA